MTASHPLKVVKPQQLSDSVIQAIDHWLAKFPEDQRQSALIPALTIVQDDNGGWLTEPLIEAVADYIGVPRIAAYEVATFYSMFELKKVGRHKISVCTNVSCLLRGCEDIVSHLEDKLKIRWGQTTEDGKFTLKEVECLGSCGTAPMMQIGKRYYENLTVQKVDEILDGLE